MLRGRWLTASCCSGCRIASVEAQTRLICLTLRCEVFVEILGPLEQQMTREKSPQVITQRLLKLQTKGTPTHMPAEVCTQPFFHHLHPPSLVALLWLWGTYLCWVRTT